MKYSIEELEKKYCDNCDIHKNMDIDSKIANKAAKELIKLNKYMRENIEVAKIVIDDLLQNPNVNVQIWIAGVAIDVHYQEKKAIDILYLLGKNKDIGILAMNARLRLIDRGMATIHSWS